MVLTDTGLAKVFQRVKSFVIAQLNSKASVLHTHTYSEIVDLPNGIAVDSTLDGTSSNAIANSAVKNALDGLTSAGLLPIGSYIQFAGSQAPAGFLVCNGGEISRTTYSALFAVIGTTYGSGDGSTTFNLPNLTDRFLQGSTTSGTVKNAGLPDIYGDAVYTPGFINGARVFLGGFGAGGAFSFANTQTCSNIDYGGSPIAGTYAGDVGIYFNASRSNSIYGNSSTVQPPALTCLICIKY